jgi:hypothetical protein
MEVYQQETGFKVAKSKFYWEPAVSYTVRAAFAEGIPTVAAVLTAVSHLAVSSLLTL